MDNKTMVKVNKEELMERVLLRLRPEVPDAGDASQRMKEFSVTEVCDAMLSEITDIVDAGNRLSLTGFGSFYAQVHRGHPVQFGGASKTVGDYRVFKFSASNVLNRRLRGK